MKIPVLTLALLAIAVPALAGDAKTEIQAFQVKVEKALKAKDIVAFEKATRSICTKDFVHIENGRKMNYDQMLAQMKMGFGMMDKVVKVEGKMEKFTKTNDKAVVITHHHFEFMTKAPEGGKASKVVMIGKTKDTFKLVKGKWYMASMEWTEQKMTMDGKPMNMGGG